jgi:hypothetical protein
MFISIKNLNFYLMKKLIIFLLFTFAWQVQAQQVREIAPVGFSGTSYQKDNARSDFRGFRVRAGWWIDAITMISQNASHNRRGGAGGSAKTFILSGGEKILRISGSYGGQYGNYIYSIQFHTNQRNSPVYGEKRGNRTFNLRVPSGSEFAGISTKYGKHLNAIGLLYKNKTGEGTIGGKKAAPKLYSPVINAKLDNGCSTNTSDPTKWNFSWYKVDGATRYWFYVKNRNSTNPLINAYATTNSYNYTGKSGSYIASHLTSGWTWRVKAEVNGVWTDWSSPRAFTVEAVNTDCGSNNHNGTRALAPSLYSPSNNAKLDNSCSTRTNSMTWNFSWSQVSGADLYEIEAKNRNSSRAMISTTSRSNSYNYTGRSGSFIADHLTSGWTWKVRARVNGVWSGWSSSRSFSVEKVNTDCPAPRTVITLRNEAGYVANFTITYTLNGSLRSLKSGNVALSWVKAYTIPAGATNINIVAKAVVPLSSDKRITSQNVKAGAVKCFKVYGTVFSPQWSFNCK